MKSVPRTKQEPPLIARTMSGCIVSLGTDRWAYRDTLFAVSLSFASLPARLSDELIATYKQVLLWYVENVSPEYLLAIHQAFLRLVDVAFARRRNVAEIGAADVLNFKAEAGITHLSKLAALIKRWNGMGYPAVQDAASLLKCLTVGGGPKGTAVLMMDPHIGPFTDVEWGAIQSAVDDAFIDGKIGEDVYCLVWLFLALGARPIQLAAMKVCDVLQKQDESGLLRYSVQVPRAKQGLPRPRMQFRERPLIKEIGAPLCEYAQRVQARFAGELQDARLAPLFPATEWAEAPAGFEYHRTSGSLGASLRQGLMRLQIRSERTGDRLNLAAIRFRRTVGTRAAQEGHGELVIAELLDHTDTQNVGVYVAAVPEIADRIDRAVAFELAPLALAFKGHVVRNESEAIRGGEPGSRIIDLRIDRSGQAMGSCGQHAECHFAAPIACYTCRSFQPWADGPHEAVLAFLLERRDRLLSQDKRMASIQDRTILAVAQVIQMCQEWAA